MISGRKGQGMRYITAEQFKGQPEEVQKVFLDWWEPELYDLFCKQVGEFGVVITHIGDNHTLGGCD